MSVSTMRTRKTSFAVAILLFVAVTAWISASRAAAERRPAAEYAAQDFGEFVALCPLSHRAPDDPIVHPQHFGASHLHDFFGNVSTSATATVHSLLVAGTTCDPIADRSAYWVPTLFDARNVPIGLENVTIYYFVDVTPVGSVQPYPLGLKIIAGDAKATAPPTPARYKWSCLGAPDSSTSDFVVCPPGAKLEVLLNFPDCWNGVDLDSVDHQSHMAYSAGGKCPASHPVPVPRLQFKLRYATRGEVGMRLSSGAAHTMHGDFFNAWEPAALENRMNCLRTSVKCGPQGFDGPIPAVTATPVAHSLHVRLPIVGR